MNGGDGGDDHNHNHHHHHHGHGHSCGHEHHDHDHDHDDADGEAWSLYTVVDTGRLLALNEAEPESLKHVLRPWHERNNASLRELESDADEQLLLKIPFTSPVGIRSLCVIGGGDTQNPATIKAFVNREVLDFETAEAATGKAVQQTFELVERNPTGEIEYPTKYTKFQNVSTLWLFVQRNFGADTTRIRYIGLKGTFTRYKREAVHTVYEARPTKAPKDVMNSQHNRFAM